METISRHALAEQLLATMTRDHLADRRSDLDSLCGGVDVRRADVRSTLTALHHAGYLDVLRMRLTLAGFAAGMSLIDQPVRAIRRTNRKSIAA
jgi:hypothetical protein